MIINKVLDAVFARKSNIAVMRALKNYSTGISGREVSRLVGMIPKNTLITLTYLEDLGIVNRVRGGREHLFSLNRNHYLVKKGILPILDVETKFLESINKDIKLRFRNKCKSVFLYGSVVRKEETIESDFDICIVYSSNNKRSEIEETFSQLRSFTYNKYGVNLSPFYISVSEFVKRAKISKPPINHILKEGKLIYGDSIRRLLNG